MGWKVSGSGECERSSRSDLDGFDQLVQVTKRLEHDQVGARPAERVDLLAQRLGSLALADSRPLLHGHRRRDRASHQHAAPSGDGLPGNSHASPVDVGDAITEAMLGEPEPARTERIGLQDIDASADVTVVNGPHQGRVGEVQGRQGLVERVPSRVQHRPHRAVADHDEVTRQRITQVHR